MIDPFRAIVSEPGVDSPQEYGHRVRRLAATYWGLFGVSLVGEVLVAWRGKYWITLAQRTNVETLTLAFLLIFFAYLAVLSAPGALGALKLFRWWAVAFLRG